jgi:hypothetical protein
LIGDLEGLGGHAICAVGFRSRANNACDDPFSVTLEDAGTEFLYIHDDNLGPNVRFRIKHECARNSRGDLILDDKGTPVTTVYLEPDAPNKHEGCPTDAYPVFRPSQLVVAVHNDLRTSPDALHVVGMKQARAISALLNNLMVRHGLPPQNISLSTRFMKLSDYLGEELKRLLGSKSTALSKARLTLCEKVAPMSLHIGVVRIGVNGSVPLVDILYDTTDSDRNHPTFAHVVYDGSVQQIINILVQNNFSFGEPVVAY